MEKYEVSVDLIEKVQILLKKEAGLDSLNFNDHSLDSLPSSFLTEAISGSNPSIHVLRCKNCNGDLLRGSESIICVYCGHTQIQDVLPHPISFKSTSAFQWFLNSLHLDGFETVGTPHGGTPSGDRSWSSVKEDEKLLSDFLDLQLKWPDYSRGLGVNKEEQLPGKRYLSLVGVDVEEILASGSRDHASSASNEQPVDSQNIEIDEFRISGERNLNFFENTPSSQAASRTGDGGNDESFSDWGADFQSATPDPGHERLANVSIPDASLGTTSNNNNIWSNLDTGLPFNSKESDGNVLVEGDGKVFESVDTSFDWLPDQQHTTKEDSANNEKRDVEDHFDEWGDFRMSVNEKITECEPSSIPVSGTDSSGGLVMSDPVNDSTGFVVSDNIELQYKDLRVPDDAWDSFMKPSTGVNIQSQTISDNSDQHVNGDAAFTAENDLALLDGTYFKHLDIPVEYSQNKSSDQGEPPTGLWNNDMHFVVKGDLLRGGESKSHAHELDDSFDLWNDFKGSDNHQQAANIEAATKISTEGGGIFDAWNDFAGRGVEKTQELTSSLEVGSRKDNGNQGDSVALWNGNSHDLWSDFTGSTGGSDSKPIGNDISYGAWNDFSSSKITPASQPQTSNTGTSEDQAVFKDDDIFSSWPDIRSSEVQGETISLGSNDTKTTLDQVSFQKAPKSRELVADNSSISSWGYLGGTPSNLGHQLQNAGTESSENKLSNGGGDFFPGLSNIGKLSTSQPDNQLQCDGVSVFDDKSTCENDDSFDLWTDFTSSSNAQANLNGSVQTPDVKEAVQHGNRFDAWNVIDSSSNVQAAKDTAVAIGKTPEINLFSPNLNIEYVGPNSSLYSDQYAQMFSSQKGSAPVAFSSPEGADLIRREHGDVDADVYVDRLNPSERNSKETLDHKSSVAETLISEMHDLSFMLESHLSIPKSGT